MKTPGKINYFFTLLVIPIILIFSFLLPAENPETSNQEVPLIAGAESKLWIDGNSTLHKYSARATSFELSGKAIISSESLKEISGKLEELQITIPVKALKSGEGGLDKNMYKDLKADTCPTIVFQFKNCVDCPDSFPLNKPINLKVEGNLNVACVEKPIELELEVTNTSNGLRVTGKKQLLMTDYGIKPRKFLVFMKVNNKVNVNFDLLIKLKK